MLRIALNLGQSLLTKGLVEEPAPHVNEPYAFPIISSLSQD